MLHIVCRTSTQKLLIQKSMARLFQAWLYGVLPEREHEGYVHQSGKRFKSTNFRIRYFQERFEIDFTALDPEYERIVAMAALKEGLKLGAVRFADTTVSMVDRSVSEDTRKIEVRGHVCAAIKNGLTGRKIFLEPGDPRHNEIVTRHALQKYETLKGAGYEGALTITPTWQNPKPDIFWYEKSRYVAWSAAYRIEGEKEMLELLFRTGLGSDTMKNLGFLERIDGGSR